MSASADIKTLTPPDIAGRKGAEPIACLTAYTTPMARLVDRHCDVVLVGDSVGMVLHGLPSTLGVSLDMKYTGDGARVGEKSKDGTPSVSPKGPSAKAGIKPGDVITKVDGQRVHSGEELIVKIRSHRPGDRLPGGIEAFLTARAAEVVFWIPQHRALVPGDVLLGDGNGGLRLCPPTWLPEASSVEKVAESLRPLLELPVERVLVSHGEPVLENGGAALAKLLAKP